MAHDEDSVSGCGGVGSACIIGNATLLHSHETHRVWDENIEGFNIYSILTYDLEMLDRACRGYWWKTDRCSRDSIILHLSLGHTASTSTYKGARRGGSYGAASSVLGSPWARPVQREETRLRRCGGRSTGEATPGYRRRLVGWKSQDVTTMQQSTHRVSHCFARLQLLIVKGSMDFLPSPSSPPW